MNGREAREPGQVAQPIQFSYPNGIPTEPAVNDRAMNWSESVSQLRRLLGLIAADCPKSGEHVKQAIALLDKADRTIARGPTVRAARPRVRGDSVEEYRIEPSERGLCLTEVRSTGAQPFRCPREIYDAVVEVLAGAEDGVSFEELRKQASKRLQQNPPPPIYLFRIVLRFLKFRELIQHAGRRFRPTLPSSKFDEATRRAWRQVEDAPFRPGSPL